MNADSDGDGLPDGEEMKILSQTVQGQPIYYCHLYSDPCMADSDGDEYNDVIDPRPLEFNINDVFAANMGKLETLAKEYSNDKSDVDWLIFMFIRQFNADYIGGNWTAVAGQIDQDFINFVITNDKITFIQNINIII